MGTTFDAERKAIRKAQKAMKELGSALREVSSLGDAIAERPFEALTSLATARSSCQALSGLGATMDAIEAKVAELTLSSEQNAEREKNRLMAELDEALRRDGYRLEGHVPKLKCGPLTLELVTGEQPEIRVHYGPAVALLATCKPVPSEVAAEVRAQMKLLEGEPLDDDVFLKEIRVAWRVAMARGGAEAGDKVPIVNVIAELAVGRQTRGWRNNPQKLSFQPYGRVQFAHDLARLGTRRVGHEELVLTVATRDQTKSEADHLWVSGTHYAYVSFKLA